MTRLPGLVRLFVMLALAAPTLALPNLALARDATPRLAVMSAFPPELTALRSGLAHPHEETIAGVTFTTGELEGRPVVLLLSGQSMVNAAMAAQAGLDHFTLTGIVFSGIAGGVDPSLDIGDVVVPAQWGSYLETVAARQTQGGYAPPADERTSFPPFGMMYPRAVIVSPQGKPMENRFWFPADPILLATAGKLADTPLKRCLADRCLTRAPKVVIGGAGVSGQSFVDNADLRRYAFATFHAQVLDMESSAVAQVAYVNGVPFIAFRSLSDLAGGGEGPNQVHLFFQLAADNSAAVVRAFLKALP
jgi:adenosylhomocysteine nucleosidase